jgi:hypothetical protein
MVMVGSKSGHDRREARPTTSVGLAKSTAGVGPYTLLAWVCRVFFGRGSPVVV